MTTKDQLRKVTFILPNNKQKGLTGFFHQWSIDWNSHVEAALTYGIVEEEETGQVYQVNPEDIVFTS